MHFYAINILSLKVAPNYLNNDNVSCRVFAKYFFTNPNKERKQEKRLIKLKNFRNVVQFSIDKNLKNLSTDDGENELV